MIPRRLSLSAASATWSPRIMVPFLFDAHLAFNMKYETHVKVRPEKFGAVIFETLREKVFVSNETGAEILRLIETQKGSREIAAELAQRYDGDPAAIENDVEEFIANLKQQGIVKDE